MNQRGKAPDWRLQGQERYLQGVTLYRKPYTPPRADWDHDHCEFCHRKFADTADPEVLSSGYTTEDQYHWICADCFSDFQERFKWRLGAYE